MRENTQLFWESDDNKDMAGKAIKTDLSYAQQLQDRGFFQEAELVRQCAAGNEQICESLLTPDEANDFAQRFSMMQAREKPSAGTRYSWSGLELEVARQTVRQIEQRAGIQIAAKAPGLGLAFYVGLAVVSGIQMGRFQNWLTKEEGFTVLPAMPDDLCMGACHGVQVTQQVQVPLTFRHNDDNSPWEDDSSGDFEWKPYSDLNEMIVETCGDQSQQVHNLINPYIPPKNLEGIDEIVYYLFYRILAEHTPDYQLLCEEIKNDPANCAGLRDIVKQYAEQLGIGRYLRKKHAELSPKEQAAAGSFTLLNTTVQNMREAGIPEDAELKAKIIAELRALLCEDPTGGPRRSAP